MGIPELLRGVQEARGYSSVEDMAFRESMRLGERVPVATLRSWMTKNQRFRRQPLTWDSLERIAKITGLTVEDVVETIRKDARESSATEVNRAVVA